MKTSRQGKTYAASPVTISCQTSKEQSTWTLESAALPRLMNCRARLVWRYAGEDAWHDEMVNLPLFSGDRFAQMLCSDVLKLEMNAQKRPNGGWEFGCKCTNPGNRPIELSRFNYLDGAIDTSCPVAMLLLQRSAGSHGFGFSRLGEETPPARPVHNKPPVWFDLPARDKMLPDVIYDEPNWICGVDSGFFFRNAGDPGWVRLRRAPDRRSISTILC